MAIQKESIELVSHLNEGGANLDVQDNNGRYVFSWPFSIQTLNNQLSQRSALHLAIEDGYTELAFTLINGDASINVKDSVNM